MKRVFVMVAVAVCVAALLPKAFARRFAEWRDPVHLDAPINTAESAETNPSLSRDGLTLYFRCVPSLCPQGDGTYVAHRASPEAPWGTPQFLGPEINGFGADYAFISGDGHRLYLHSSIAGGYGGDDIYVSRRHNKDDDFGWGLPENLGPGVNTAANEHFASVYEDDATGEVFLYFASDRVGGKDDIYVSKLQADGHFGEAELVVELSSTGVDRQPHVRRDGLECVFMSNRPGSMPNAKGVPSNDLWVATRSSTTAPWSTPVNLVVANSGKAEGGPAYSFDGSQLYFHAAYRPGNFDVADPTGTNPEACLSSPTCFFDIWVIAREKVTGRPRP